MSTSFFETTTGYINTGSINISYIYNREDEEAFAEGLAHGNHNPALGVDYLGGLARDYRGVAADGSGRPMDPDLTHSGAIY